MKINKPKSIFKKITARPNRKSRFVIAEYRSDFTIILCPKCIQQFGITTKNLESYTYLFKYSCPYCNHNGLLEQD